MPKIRFISSPKIPNDKVNEWAKYVKGSVHDVSSDEAERWLRRGVVEVLGEEIVSTPEVVLPNPDQEPMELRFPEIQVDMEEVVEEESETEIFSSPTSPRSRRR